MYIYKHAYWRVTLFKWCGRISERRSAGFLGLGVIARWKHGTG